MKLQEQIVRINNIMGVISENKMSKFIYEEFDNFFDNLNLVKTEPDLYQFNWLNNDNKKVFERNNWGMLWIYDCDEFSNLHYLSNMFSLSNEEFKKELVTYINDRYKSEFGNKPLQDISSEDCDDYLDF